MKKDFVKGIAVGCALSIAIGGASALADTYRKFLEVAYTDIKVVVNGKPTTPRDSDGTPVKPFISSGHDLSARKIHFKRSGTKR